MAKYIVALSGGADSVCLLLWLHAQGEVAAAAHCNFHLRGEESNRDEQFVRDLCKQLNIVLYVNHFNTTEEAKQTGESIEMAARRLRYTWFKSLLTQTGAHAIAVGHHQEDNAETILLNLVRGTGLQGLTGMQKRSHKQGFTIYRPLLSWTKGDILKYLEAHHQTYVTDSTNADVQYRRNSIRHEVLPLLQQLNPKAVQAINQMAQHLTETQCVYADAIEQLCKRCDMQKGKGTQSAYTFLAWNKLQALSHPHAVLHELLTPLAFTEAQIQAALQMRVGGIIESNHSLVTRSEQHLVFGPKPKPFSPQGVVLPQHVGESTTTNLPHAQLVAERLRIDDLPSLKCPQQTVLLDANKLQGDLQIRMPFQGERFCPFGMKGSQLLSDYMTNHHFSRIDKALALVVADAVGTVWLIGERADNRLRIDKSTKQVLRLTIHDIIS